MCAPLYLFSILVLKPFSCHLLATCDIVHLGLYCNRQESTVAKRCLHVVTNIALSFYLCVCVCVCVCRVVGLEAEGMRKVETVVSV